MPTLIEAPTTIEAAGNKPKIIQEFIGRVNSETAGVNFASLALLTIPRQRILLRREIGHTVFLGRPCLETFRIRAQLYVSETQHAACQSGDAVPARRDA